MSADVIDIDDARKAREERARASFERRHGLTDAAYERLTDHFLRHHLWKVEAIRESRCEPDAVTD